MSLAYILTPRCPVPSTRMCVAVSNHGVLEMEYDEVAGRQRSYGEGISGNKLLFRQGAKLALDLRDHFFVDLEQLNQ